MEDPKKEDKNKNEDDWDLGTPQNTCSLNKTSDDDCESCQ